MANEFARNIQDAAVNPAAFALPAAASTSTQSAGVDLGAMTRHPENVELELNVPALSATIAPASSSVTYLIETSATADFSTVARYLVYATVSGSASGIVAQARRVRLPSDCERYVRAKVTFGANCTSGAAVSATLKVLF